MRKDLSYLGGLGRRGVGYKVADLAGGIRTALGIDREWLAVLVGAGNLAQALRYRGFTEAAGSAWSGFSMPIRARWASGSRV